MGHGILYAEAKFIEDKWVEWTERQSSLTSINIHKGAVATLVFVEAATRGTHLKKCVLKIWQNSHENTCVIAFF